MICAGTPHRAVTKKISFKPRGLKLLTSPLNIIKSALKEMRRASVGWRKWCAAVVDPRLEMGDPIRLRPLKHSEHSARAVAARGSVPYASKSCAVKPRSLISRTYGCAATGASLPGEILCTYIYIIIILAYISYQIQIIYIYNLI